MKRLEILKLATLFILTSLLVAGIYIWWNPTIFAFTKAEALQQAAEWKTTPPRGQIFCGSAMTPATHVITGAERTFGTTCIPPGWKANYDEVYRN